MRSLRLARILLGWLAFCSLNVAGGSTQLFAQSSPLAQRSAKAAEKQVHLTARASVIDARAAEHPEIDFVFGTAASPQDLQHARVNLQVESRGKLVIWMMGYNADLFDRLNEMGFHAIQVHYARGWFNKLNRSAPPTADYLGNIRLEAATGRDFSPYINVPLADGMQQRAIQFVRWLAAEHPAGRWDDYLTPDGNDLCWDRVIMAGSSHGSTTSARFAVHQRVDRVVMLCGPRDQLEVWQSLPSATPANRYFGFSHVLDGGWTGDHYCRSWEMLGLNALGPIVDVDATPAPFENSRRLITRANVGDNPDRAHGCVTPGKSAVKTADGRLQHEAVWRYLFTHPVEQVGQPQPHDPDCRLDLAGEE